MSRSWIKSHTYIFARKKCRKYNAVSLGEKDVVISYPASVIRDGDQSKQPDLTNESVEVRPSAALIDVSDVGLTPTTSASGSLATMYGAPTRVGEVGRQTSHNSSIGTISSSPSPMPPQLSSSSTPVAGHGLERRSPWSEKTHAWEASSSSGAIPPNDGQFQGLDDGPSGSGDVLPVYMV
jgi:hypothetical protein